MLSARSFDLVDSSFDYEKNKFPKLKSSVGTDLHGLAQDRAIKTDPSETRRRRTIRLSRNKGQSWGFTLQTYGIRNKRTQEVEIMSYVDYVEMDGSAWIAGMRRGDVILSVNGESVESCTHKELVRKIHSCGRELRLVALFDDCCQKVELHERYLRLKKLLYQKYKELQLLEEQERRINQGIPLSRLDIFRQSNYSSTSSDWDVYSEITSPSVFDKTPTNRFAFCNQSFSSFSIGGSSGNSESYFNTDTNSVRVNSEEDSGINFLSLNRDEETDISCSSIYCKNKVDINSVKDYIEEKEADANFLRANSEERFEINATSACCAGLDINISKPNRDNEKTDTILIKHYKKVTDSTTQIDQNKENKSKFPNSEQPESQNILGEAFCKSKFENEVDGKTILSDVDCVDNAKHFSGLLKEDERQVDFNLGRCESKTLIKSSLEMVIKNSEKQRKDECIDGSSWVSDMIKGKGGNQNCLFCGLGNDGGDEFGNAAAEAGDMQLEYVRRSLDDKAGIGCVVCGNRNQRELVDVGDEGVQYGGASRCTIVEASTDNNQYAVVRQCTLAEASTDNNQYAGVSQCTLADSSTDNMQNKDVSQCTLADSSTDNNQHEDVSQCTLAEASLDNIQIKARSRCTFNDLDMIIIADEGIEQNIIIESNEPAHSQFPCSIEHNTGCENSFHNIPSPPFIHETATNLTTDYENINSLNKSHCLLLENDSLTMVTPITNLQAKKINFLLKEPAFFSKVEEMEIINSPYHEASFTTCKETSKQIGEQVCSRCRPCGSSLEKVDGDGVNDINKERRTIEHLIVPDMAVEHLVVPDMAVEHSTVPDMAVEHLVVPDMAVEHSTVPGIAIEHSTVSGMAVEHSTVPGMAVEHLVVPDMAVEHSTVSGMAVEHSIAPGSCKDGALMSHIGHNICGDFSPQISPNFSTVGESALGGLFQTVYVTCDAKCKDNIPLPDQTNCDNQLSPSAFAHQIKPGSSDRSKRLINGVLVNDSSYCTRL